MARFAIILLAATFILLIACDAGSSSTSSATRAPPVALTPAARASCAPGRAHALGEATGTVISGGIERTYVLHIPPAYDGSKLTPLVVLLHGHSMTGRLMLDYSRFGAVSDRYGFVLVAPLGTGDVPFWNQNLVQGEADDVQFANDLLDHLDQELCIDTQRTYAAGFSNGGGMSMRLACDDASRFRAVGLVAAVYLDCTPKLPLIAFHGTLDALLPFDGGSVNGLLYFAVRDAIATWAAGLACSPDATVTRPGAHIELSVYNGCAAGDGAVQLYTVETGGHTWPGADAIASGRGLPALTTQEIDASELIWQFFSER